MPCMVTVVKESVWHKAWPMSFGSTGHLANEDAALGIVGLNGSCNRPMSFGSTGHLTTVSCDVESIASSECFVVTRLGELLMKDRR